MSVYLKDDKVVVQDDLVATSEDCCCGGCGPGCCRYDEFGLNCAGETGFISDTGCYCTGVEVADFECRVEPFGDSYYSRHLTSQYTFLYSWISNEFGCTNHTESICDYCVLTRHFSDGSETVCDCCVESCSAGFCGDAGGNDCFCTDTYVSDTERECIEEDTDPPATCSTVVHYNLSDNCSLI